MAGCSAGAAGGDGRGAEGRCLSAAGPYVSRQQAKAWWAVPPRRIVVDIVFLMMGAAPHVFEVRPGELMRRASLLRSGSSRLRFNSA